MSFRQITVIGTGLIGGSFALAVRKAGFQGKIVGCDREHVLLQARDFGAIDEAIASPEMAIKGSDLIVIATPVGSIIDLIERIGPLVPADALITDVGSTKTEIMARAHDVFGDDVAHRFLPGHPMAGKEHAGVEYADANLFRDAVWLLTLYPGQNADQSRIPEFLDLLEKIGTQVVLFDPAQHDRVCALVSHLPQMLSTAFASTLVDTIGDNPEAKSIGGRALREMTRIAQSPYSMWRDIALTNTKNIQDALLRLEQKLAHIRENLRTRELEEEFERAHTFGPKK
ncbi:MAG TPA: prephenate dehydrogenase/arogenate dehydrogenase family protein [Terriglobales bacterium]|nr:prephenate dehydrogenase/arogenate dehydrogenase family protein [Terriglobales bacterium]